MNRAGLATRAMAILLVCLCAIVPASAHGGRADPAAPHRGLPIPPITHGLMPAMAAEAGAIRALADRLLWDDSTGKRLIQFVEYQSFACLWGLVPGSVTDETSPFNPCAHAYLAGVQALLARLESLHGTLGAVRDLAGRVSADAVETAPPCLFSQEQFWSGTIIGPAWSDMPKHPQLLSLFAGALLATGGMVVLGIRLLRPAVHPSPTRAGA